MNVFRKDLIVIGSMLFLGIGCSDSSEVAPNAPISVQIASSRLTPTPAVLDSFSQGFARALGSRGNRMALLSAMRASRFVSGQLDAITFFQLQASRQLSREIEIANGWPAGSLVERLRAYPRLAIELPFRSHRLASTGVSSVLVASLLNGEVPQAKAFRSDGTSVMLCSSDAGARSEALVLLTPAEAADERAEQRTTGPVEIANEAVAPSPIIYVSASGDSTVTTMERVLSGKDPNFSVISMNGSTADSTKPRLLPSCRL
jgi:hypothetical protein